MLYDSNYFCNVFILSSKLSSTNLKYVISWSLDAFELIFIEETDTFLQ